jgi:putative SOS response-associated peptidase YedK
MAVASAMLSPYHDRMPVILKPEDYDLWLDGDVRRPELLKSLLAPYPHEGMGAYAVSLRVNNPANDEVRCTEPLTTA